MRWVTYRLEESSPTVGLLHEDEITPVPGIPSLLDLLQQGEKAHATGEAKLSSAHGVLRADDVELLAPLPRTPSIRDSLSFEQHARTMARKGNQPLNPLFLEHPLFYFSNPHAVVGPFDDVQMPPGCRQFDFELEIGAVIGRQGTNLTAEEAEACIAGYVIVNDWSARDIQAHEMEAGLGPVKSKDSATTLGPAIVTPDELKAMRVGNRYDLEMTVRVNGIAYGSDRLTNMRWTFGELVAYCSRGAWIRPGDVIASGTCGNGCIAELEYVYGSDRYPWLSIGDVVELEVSGLGRIANRIVGGPEDIPDWSIERRA